MNIAFIPARCGSQTIPFKNIKIICGEPLIYWPLLALTKSKSIDQIYVATDCDEIKDVVADFNFDKVRIFDRCDVNASNTASTESVMLEFLENKKFSGDDLFVLVQVTNPFTSSNDFDNAINTIKSSNKLDSILSCVETKSYSGKLIDENFKYDTLLNKNQVTSNLGQPNFIDPIENKYYYYFEKKIKKNFFNSRIEKRKVIVFNFKKNGNKQVAII